MTREERREVRRDIQRRKATRRPRTIQQLGIPIPDREDRDWLTAPELCIEADITYRQCDYWCRTHLLVPIEQVIGSGTTRRFATDQVERARVLSDLLAAGISLPTCRQIIDELLATGHTDVGPFTLTVREDQSGGTAA